MKNKKGKTEEAEQPAPQPLVTKKQNEAARRRLVDLLDQVHSKTPDVPEEEATLDIQEAIQAVRARVRSRF